MNNPLTKQTSHMYATIKEALLKEWDPIGVRDIPEAKNEYDGYVSVICRMLGERQSKEKIFEYLWWAETEHMGLTGNRRATEQFAERLATLREKGVGAST